MARQRKYLDIDVLTAAKQRIRHIIATHDTVAVCFSGGKDSLAVLHLLREVLTEDMPAFNEGFDHRIPTQPVVRCVFRDEELIPDCVIEFVDAYRRLPWIEMLYLAIPLKSTKYILGRVIDYVQWDANRPHVRPIPEHAMTLAGVRAHENPRIRSWGKYDTFDQYTTDGLTAEFYRGKVALLTGIRASESLIRFFASVNKLNENYINRSSDGRVSLCKPIYDWEENDVFKYFHERHITYCPHYDRQLYAGQNLRVSTPLHAESAKRLGSLREIDPAFYDRVLSIFPEMAVQDRYYRQMDHKEIQKWYGESFDGIRQFIIDTLEGDRQAAALDRLDGIVGRETVNPGSYPLSAVLNYFASGGFKREMLPQRSAK